ncbi:hypothetical protein TRAPUB_11350 [Trametes pubescens]|uniref:F-box domain-containing protein n=1 Tax=Trametes pubescens TaxID=154538 RepID=A0A1M2VWZ5_TRAPU|nr:hypothetical protein TRAPUB_11350 [Trametes pubescens]
MSRLASRLWEYPPRAPAPPEKLPAAHNTLSIKILTRSMSTFQPVLSSRLETGAYYKDKTTSSLEPRSIHVLPTELLIYIFTLCEELPFRRDTPPIRAIGKLMLVCSQWRILILDTSTFWRHVSATPNFAWLTLCLERSRGCTLDLEVLAPRYANTDALALILPHARRIRSICAYLSVWRDQYEMLRPLFDVGMPCLEFLELTPIGTFQFPRPITPGSWNEPRLSISPCLRWLVAKQISSSGTSWRSLRQLKMSDTLQPRECCTCSISDLIRVISHNSSLEDIVLHFSRHLQYPPPKWTRGGEDDLLSAATQALPRISLRRLQALSLQGSLWFVSTIAQHLDFPADIPNVNIRVRRKPMDDTSEQVVVRLLMSRFRPVLERMTDMVLAGDQESQARLYSPRPRWPARRAVHNSLLYFSLEDSEETPLEGAPLLIPVEARLRALVSAMSSVQVRSLAVHVSLTRFGPAGVPEAAAAMEFWAAVFDAVPSVEHLRVIVPPAAFPQLRVDLVELVRALTPAGLGEETLRDHLALARCPLLTRLSIHGELGCGPGPESLNAVEALADCVRMRAGAGAPVDDLDLHFWHRKYSAQALDEAHRALLAQASPFVGRLVCKFGVSAGCRSCLRM